MDQSLTIALEEAFAKARARDVPLADRLAFVAAKVRSLSPEFDDAVDRFVERLEQARAGDHAPQVGEHMPSFILPDDEGHLVSLDRLLETAPVAIAFHRGHWCPYCRLNAHGLAEIQNDIAPVQIVAISAETQAYTRAIKAEAGAHFPFLTDIGSGYTLSLNLAIWVDEAMSALIAKTGWDIPRYQRQDGWILAIPSMFVVGQDGVIMARHVDPDYRRRMDLGELRAAAEAALLNSTASRAAG